MALAQKKQSTKCRHKEYKIVPRCFTSSYDELSTDNNDMESSSDNDAFHTGADSSNDGDEGSEHNYSGDGSNCDDSGGNNVAVTSHCKPSKKKLEISQSVNQCINPYYFRQAQF